MPSLCFYELDVSTNTLKGDAKFKIQRAELFLDCDESGSVSFLTNAALLSATRLPNNKLDFARP